MHTFSFSDPFLCHEILQITNTCSVLGPRRLHNFRNVAGYTTEDGRKMKSGMLFRSATPTGKLLESRTTLGSCLAYLSRFRRYRRGTQSSTQRL
jgi:hypothetical protein